MPIVRGPAPYLQLQLPADDDLVAATSMLDWTPIAAAPGQNPMVGIDMFKAARAFLGRCSLSREPADQTIFQQTPFIQFDLTDAAWDRIISEYVNADLPQVLQDAGVRSLCGFDEAVSKLVPSNPGSWVISGPDLLLRESFDVAAVQAVPARGRGRGQPAAVAAAAAIPGPPELLFLNLCTISLLEDGSSASAPLQPLSRLAGMLGPFSTRGKRLDPVSTVQLTSALLRQQLATRFGCSSDGAMAVNLKDFILDTYLPEVFAAFRASEEELRREARDACTYRRSSQGRTDVEISRMSYLRFRHVYPTAPLYPRSRASTPHRCISLHVRPSNSPSSRGIEKA